MTVEWEKDTEIKFKRLLEKVPVFLRGIAEDKVSKKAAALAIKENRQLITEKDMVDAFFIETPFGFHGPMKTDMETLGIDYQKYGHPK